MDEPANVRWAQPCQQFGGIAYDIYLNFLRIFPEFMVDDLEAIMLNWFKKNAQEPYKSEMEYFANCTNIPLDTCSSNNNKHLVALHS